MNKGYSGKEASFANGGAVLGRTRDFLKTPDAFRENKGNPQNFGKSGGEDKAPPAKGKELAAIKPKS